MDASIADILASVTRAHEVANAVANGLPIPSQIEQQQEDLQSLTRAWISERMAPELLPYPTDLMDRVMARLREQIETIEDRTARMDAGTSFTLVVMQTELERFKFLIRSLLRTRIAKLDAHPAHLLSLGPSISDLLSRSEHQYLQTHAALLERHYNASFLSSFPAKLRRLDDRAGAGGVGMVEGPDLDRAVFIRCLGVPKDSAGIRTYGTVLDDDDEDDEDRERRMGNFDDIHVSCGFTVDKADEEDASMRGVGASDGERIIRMKRGEVWMVRWSAVKEAFARGECELI